MVEVRGDTPVIVCNRDGVVGVFIVPRFLKQSSLVRSMASIIQLVANFSLLYMPSKHQHAQFHG